MRPPWEVGPAVHADKFWIVAKSDYREKWRAWFCSLSEGEQSNYVQQHQPPESCSPFYSVFGQPPYDPVKAAEKYHDADGDFSPPWITFPQIPLGSIGWRMGAGEDYWIVFDKFYKALNLDQKVAFRAKYPEPSQVEQGFPWTGFYDRKESN